MPELLELVAQHRVPTDHVSAAQATSQFSTYIQRAEAVDLEMTGDFLRDAVRLMLIKSEMLLPRPEVDLESNEEVAVVRQVLLERPEIDAGVVLLRSREGLESFPAAPRLVTVPSRVERLSPLVLERILDDLDKREKGSAVHVAAPAFVRLEVALSRLIRGLRSRAKVSLKRLLRGANRADAVIHFLAVLELARRREALVAQASLFDDIIVDGVRGGVEVAGTAV